MSQRLNMPASQCCCPCHNVSVRKVPYKCPVCDGKTFLKDEIYPSTMGGIGLCQEYCKSCDGKGIVWG